MNTVLNGHSQMIDYTMTPDFSFDSTTTPISNCFFGIKKHKLEELLLQMSNWK